MKIRRLSDEIPQVISGTGGGKLEVLEPEELRADLLRQAEVMAKKYRGT